jgi:sarcosine oxidase
MSRADVVVIGAGAMGSSTAWWLARRGHDVVLLERFEAGHDRGSSHGVARIFRHAYDDAHYVRMAKESLSLWRELEDDAGQVLVELTGCIDHGPAPVIERVAAALIGESVAREVLDPEVASRRWPGMRFDDAVLFHPEGGRCLADATVRALQDRAAAHGAVVRFGVGPASLEVNGAGDGVVVRGADESWAARVAVVTAGGWVREVLGSVASVPATVTLEQVQHFTPLDPAQQWPSFLHHRAGAPLVYGLLSSGEGMKVDEHHAGRPIDPETDSREADPVRRAAVADYVREWFPGLDPTPVHTATCLYTTTPTEDFVIDRIGPVVIGSPCSGHGFKFTPLVGRMLADLADGTETRPDPRFALRPF